MLPAFALRASPSSGILSDKGLTLKTSAFNLPMVAMNSFDKPNFYCQVRKQATAISDFSFFSAARYLGSWALRSQVSFCEFFFLITEVLVLMSESSKRHSRLLSLNVILNNYCFFWFFLHANKSHC